MSLIDSSLQGLSNDVKTLTKQMKEVLKFYSHASSKERQSSQAAMVRGRSVDQKPKMQASNILAQQQEMAGQANGAGSARNRSYPAARHGGRGEAESGAA